MADCVISAVATKVFEYLWDLTIPQGQNLFCTETIIKNLENTMFDLTLKREDIQDRVQQAKRRTEIIENPVEWWLTEVSSELEKAEKLRQEMEANNNCFQGCCPPWRRYRIAKQVVEKTNKMTQLINRSDINPFSHLAPLQSNYYNSKNYAHFESTKLVFDELLKALQDDDTCLIGLYGMGGSGKTSLATEVGKWAVESNLVDLVLSITVSRDPIITNIQEKLAEKLNLELNEKFVEERAERLRLGLKAERRRVLIIVDDLWKEFDLNHIGIDFDTKGGGMCKVLLTSRRESVCNSMNCWVKFQLKPLSEEEAWTLFRNFAGIDDQFPSNLLDVAIEVAKECKGLPIALKAVGSSLKGSLRDFQADEWKRALHKLKAAIPIEGEGNAIGAISSLNLSYEYLKDDGAKLLFLMCAMFPEDHEIYIEDLVRYGAGLGIGGELPSFELRRNFVRGGLHTLIDFGLLLYFEDKKYYVKMHDVARDTALWIASKKDPTIMVNLKKDLNSFFGDKAIRKCFGVSSWHDETDRISQQLDAPQLEILILNTGSSLDLSYMSFELMKKLMVMAIISESYEEPISLPQSIQSLTNLKTLCLRGWQLGDITFILSLEGLEVLDLQYCVFNEVPDKIEKLHNLKLLDLRYATIENYNSKAIGRCSQLEEFYVSSDSDRTYKWPPLSQCFVHDVAPISLQRYELNFTSHRIGWLGGRENSKEMGSIMKVLGLQKFDVSTIDGSKENLLQKTEYVCFNGLCGGSKNIVPDIDQAVGCMNELNMLDLVACLEIECLFDATSNHASSFQGDASLPCRLISLGLVGMKNLTEVCRGEPSLDFFKKLEEIYIRRCQQLHNVFPRQCNLDNLKILSVHDCAIINFFSMSVAKNMQQLEKMTIGRCPELRDVITSDDGGNTRGEISLALNNSHLLFPNLKELRISKCPKLQVIFPISCGQQNEIHIIHPHLQVFELDDLDNLLGIFPQNYTPRWPSVRTLSWRNCPKLTTSWICLELKQQDVVCDEVHQEHVTPKLQELTLINLPESNLLWFGPTATQILSFQYLQRLKINGFKEMKVIFSMAILRSLSGLTSLNIGNCDELVEIIEENEESKNSSQVFFPKLNNLKIKQCNKLKSLFSIAIIRRLPQLNTLRVKEAAQLKEIFGQSSEGDIVNEMETVVPNLREIRMKELPSFVNIHQGFMMHKVRLECVNVNKCPKFTPVLGATQTIPLHHRTEEKLIVWFIALSMNQLSRQQMCPVALKAFLSIERFKLRNSGAEGILQLQLVEEGQGGLQKHLNSNLKELYLHELTELRFIWSGPTQFLGCHKLTCVTVDGCPKLKTVFPAGIVGSLQNLYYLGICNCEELEEIFESGPTQFLGFHKLGLITVDGCPKLKTVFRGSIVGSLKILETQILESLTVRNCEELEEIFESQVECFPYIHQVEVEKCNKLKCIFYADCMASRHYTPPGVLKVRECSQLERIYSLKRATEVDSEDHGEQEKVLGSLSFELKSLPNFTEIGLGIKLKEKRSQYHIVEECPKYIQQFAESREDVAGSSQL